MQRSDLLLEVFSIEVLSKALILYFEFKMASNSQGIQQLLAAEKAAAEKVGAARKGVLIHVI